MSCARVLGTGYTLLAAALIAPSTAAAHLRTGTSAVDYGASVSSPRPSPRAPIAVGIYQSARALHLGVRRDHTVVVLGSLGEPFLRLDADGLAVNTASPTAAASGLLRKGEATVGATAWHLQRGRDSVVWHDARLQRLPPGARRARWSVPILLDGRAVSIRGELWRVVSPAFWPWLLSTALLALPGALVFRVAQARLATVCFGLGVASAACAIVAAAGFALSAYASPGTWIAGLDETLFAAAGVGVLAWGPRGARAAAGAGLGVLGLAVGLSSGAIFLHAIVLSALPGTASRVLVALALGSGTASAVAGALYDARLEAPLQTALSAR